MAIYSKQLVHKLRVRKAGKELNWSQRWSICDQIYLLMRNSKEPPEVGEEIRLGELDSVYNTM